MQGLNVVIPAMDDALLKDSIKELKQAFPKQEVGMASVQ